MLNNEILSSTRTKMSNRGEITLNQKAKDDIQFLKELQKQLQWENQNDYDSQASPRFWVVMDYKKEPCWSENADEWVVYGPGECKEYFNTKESILETIENHELGGEALENWKEDTEILANSEGGFYDDDEFLDWIKHYVDDEAYLVPQHEVEFIVPNTMFLTKEEAKRHLELNHYHYSKKAHTYAMTAWRSTKVEKLLDVLHNFDFEQLEKIEDDRSLFLGIYVEKIMNI